MGLGLLNLIMAGLLSIGANGLAGTLFAFGAHKGNEIDFITPTPTMASAQTDFDPDDAEIVVRFFRPDGGGFAKRSPDRRQD